MRYKGRSNLQDAQKIWEEEEKPVNVEFFTIGQLKELAVWCRARAAHFNRLSRTVLPSVAK